MKIKKLVVMILVVAFVFFIYFFLKDNKLNYVALGDSIACGITPYGEDGYSYTDYIKEYLESNEKLNSYVNYAVSGYKTDNIIDDISKNKEIDNSNIRESLRESDLVTISIGANNLISKIDYRNLDLSNIDSYLKTIDGVMVDIDNTLKEVRNYAKNDIIVIGYYNPFPMLYNTNKEQVDMVFNYLDKRYKDVCENQDIKYLSVYSLFRNNSDFLPNPFDIHPNIDGYKGIGKLIVDNYFTNLD